MEVMVPAQNIDLNFNGIPCSPLGNFYFSAPTSPKQISYFYSDIDEFFIKTGGDNSNATVPFDWEEKPGVPKSPFKIDNNDENDDFAFDVSNEMEIASLSADELFDGGVIRPLKNATRRERISSLPRNFAWEDDKKETSTISSPRKWRFKDFFLFRSASEGRTPDKYPTKKYQELVKKEEDFKCPSTRGIERRRRRRSMSAHELHYTMNRAVSEDLKKKTFLPYKQGILGRLAFNPALHAISNGFGVSPK